MIILFKYCLIVSYLLLNFQTKLAYTTVLNHISITDEKYFVFH